MAISISFGFTLFIGCTYLAVLVSSAELYEIKANTDKTFCPLEFKDCGSTAGKAANVTIDGKCVDRKAMLKRNSVVTVDFKFSAKNSESNLTSKVYGVIAGIPVPFPLDNPDACTNAGLKCPIAANTIYNYLPVLNVKSEYPKIKLVVKWELINLKNENVFCVELPAQITD